MFQFRAQFSKYFAAPTRVLFFLIPIVIVYLLGQHAASILEINYGSSSDSTRIITVFFAIVLTVIWEELVFRLYLPNIISSRALKPVISSLIFTLFHLLSMHYFGLGMYEAALSSIFIFSFSLILYYSFVITKNIIVPMLLHFAYNISSVGVFANLSIKTENKIVFQPEISSLLLLLSGLFFVFILLWFYYYKMSKLN